MTLEPAVVLAAIAALVTGLGTALRMIYKDLVKDRDFWRSRALRLDQQAEKATAKAEKSGG